MENQKILIIDDSQASLLITKIIFKDFRNAEVFTEEESINAMSVIDEIKPDLIFMDIMMPQLDGTELLKKIKENPDTENIPVIILSAKDCETTRNEVIEAGASAFHSKPIDILEIKELAMGLIPLVK